MASNIGDLVATATLDIAPFMTNTKNLKTYLKGLDNSLRSVENSFKTKGDKLNKMRLLYDQTGQSLTNYQKLLARQSDKYNQLKAEIGDVNNATEAQKGALLGARSEMTATAARVVELQGKYNALGRELSVFNQFGNAAIDFGNKMQSVSRSLGGVGSALTRGVTVPIAAGAGAVIKAAISWESAFAGVKKTNEEVVDSNGRVIYSYQDLENGLRGLATKLPASHQQIAAVAEAAGQLGIKTENVVSFTKTMIDMGESTNMSAEQAATSLARLANITKLPQNQFSNLGSAIVDLGNNFATTESEITEMALRLAGAGTQIGLTHGDILGLATALSSVGVEAEMGGSAVSKIMVKMQVAAKTGLAQMEQLSAKTGMTRRELELMSSNNSKGFKNLADSIGMTTNEMNGIIKSSRDLENFGKIAGMSAQEFKQAFEKDAIGAIQKFLQGLGDAEKHGSSAIEMLNEMGIKEVRLRDSLLRAANAQDLFKNAVARGNKAFNENTALTNEANKRYETTASKLKILRNELVETAIKFGGPLLDAIRNGVKAGEPYLQMLSKMAENFNSLDKEQQQNIIKWGLIVAAAGPAISILGKGANVLGSLSKGAGLASKGLGWVARELQNLLTAKTSITELGSATTSVTAGTKTLSGALGGLSAIASPLGLALGTAGLVGGLILLANAQDSARTKAEKFGTKLSGDVTSQLEAFNTKMYEAKNSMTNFETGATKSTENVKKAVTSMLDEIKQGAESYNKELEKVAQKYGISPDKIEKAKKNNEQIVKNAETMTQQISEIYSRHNGNVKQLTDTEKQIVESNVRQLAEARVRVLGLGKEKEKAILRTFNGDVANMTKGQLEDRFANLKQAMTEEQTLYKKQKADLKKLLDGGVIDREEYNTKMATLEAQHKATMSKFGEALAKVAQMHQAKSGGLVKYTEEAKKILSEYGLSFEDLANKATASAGKQSTAAAMIGNYTAKMSQDAKNATDQWNALVLDPKTGEVKTNASEEIAKALTAKDGWKNMEFVLKNANIKSNARAQVADALIAQGKWDSTTPKEKELLFQNAKGLKAIYESKEQLEIWNSIPEKVKKLLADDTDFSTKATVAKDTLERWNSLTPEQKKLVATNNTTEAVNLALSTLGIIPEHKLTSLEAKNNTQVATSAAQALIDGVKQLAPAQVHASDQTIGPTSSAQSKINSVKQLAPAFVNAKDLTGGPTGSAQSNINSVHGKTVHINAVDNASGVIGSIRGMLSTLADKTINVFTRHINHAKGTNFHPGGLAIVNDQKGPLYRELVTLPSGEAFIPEGRDVLLPLPRGSKVLPANKTKRLFPRYAKGIGFEDTNIAQLTSRMSRLSSEQRIEISSSNNSELKNMILELIQYFKDRESDDLLGHALDTIKEMAKRPTLVAVQADRQEVARLYAQPLAEEQAKREAILRAVDGKGW